MLFTFAIKTAMIISSIHRTPQTAVWATITDLLDWDNHF